MCPKDLTDEVLCRRQSLPMTGIIVSQDGGRRGDIGIGEGLCTRFGLGFATVPASLTACPCCVASKYNNHS
jgi:hypothetical protein